MLCKIADLFAEIPAAGGLAPRCVEYLAEESKPADIVLREDMFRAWLWPSLSYESMVYMESGFIFYTYLQNFRGLMLHASAVELDGKAYLFSGPCGMGKSTHTRLWQKTFEKARVFNDDKPALRRMGETWYAYGTPWCGKDGINRNMKVPLAGICFLKQSQENHIRRMPANEALVPVINQTLHRFESSESLDRMLKLVEQLVLEIPVFELENRPEPGAAILSYETMRHAAEELKL